MKSFFKVIGKCLKVYLIFDVIFWALIGVTNLLDCQRQMYERENNGTFKENVNQLVNDTFDDATHRAKTWAVWMRGRKKFKFGR